ncbi:hypothetical protein [Aestuariimicrobium kwangyangense]|uniref:hypothetical protein n=1 Tax=Aestuariimicrobium kwangyangense TaxID=396389 RepID=UPI0004051200|nr:hypothetical protein [Aestuariimicrobium kwangyangense]
MIDWAHVGIVVGMGLLVTLLGGRVVTAVFRMADSMSDRHSRQHPDPVRSAPPHPEPADQPPLGAQAAAVTLRGGAWIGVLERLAVFASLLAHYPEGLAIALAVKGLARYPELKAPETGVAERFIIGTFVSVLLACGAAGLTLWLVTLV